MISIILSYYILTSVSSLIRQLQNLKNNIFVGHLFEIRLHHPAQFSILDVVVITAFGQPLVLTSYGGQCQTKRSC